MKTILLISILALIYASGCTKPEQAAPTFPITFEPVEGHTGLYRIYCASDIQAWYHNSVTGETMYITWRCFDEATGMYWRVVGEGEICVNSDTWCQLLGE